MDVIQELYESVNNNGCNTGYESVNNNGCNTGYESVMDVIQ